MDACRRFLVRSWVFFEDEANALRYRGSQVDLVHAQAELFEAALRSKEAISFETASELNRLALLKAVDQIGTDIDLFDVDTQLVADVPYTRGIWPTEIEGLDTAHTLFRSNPKKSLPPAGRQRWPKQLCFQRHSVLPEKSGVVSFPLSNLAYYSAVREEAEISSGQNEVIRVYLGGYKSARDYSWLSEREGALFFEPNRGIDADSRFDEIKLHISRAQECGAEFVVLPELTVSEEILERVVMWLKQTRGERNRAAPMVLCLGTSHMHSADGRRVNRGRIVLCNGLTDIEWFQDKNFAFGTDDSHREDLTDKENPAPFVRAFWNGRELFSILICYDFLNTSGVNLVSKLSSNIILVPSMGERNTASRHMARCSELKPYSEPYVVVCQEMHGLVTEGHRAWFCSFDGRGLSPSDAADDPPDSWEVVEFPIAD